MVREASWNWSKIYEILEGLEGLEDVVQPVPLGTRLIADARIKTDEVDAAAFATRLRGNSAQSQKRTTTASHSTDEILFEPVPQLLNKRTPNSQLVCREKVVRVDALLCRLFRCRRSLWNSLNDRA